MFFTPIPCAHYRGATLTEGKEWYISFYVLDPVTNRLKRIRFKFNRIKDIRERRKAARIAIQAIDQRLALGWNPLLERLAPMAHGRLFDAMDAFLKVKKKEMESASVRCYGSFIKIFRSWLVENGYDSESYACSVTRETALAFIGGIETRFAAKTFNNYVAFYKSLFNWMMEKGYTDVNPFEGIHKKAKKLTKKKRRVLTDEELGRLFSYLQRENEAYLAMCLICYCCFVRPKEMAMLRCEDVDLDRQLLHVKAEIAKNDNDSYRTIPDDLVPILRRIDLSHPDWYLFSDCCGYGFLPGKVQVCSRKIAKYWDCYVRPACGFGQDLQFYSLKDTGITNMLGDGVPINLVQQQADHSSVAMTAIYVGRKAEASEKLRAAGLRGHAGVE